MRVSGRKQARRLRAYGHGMPPQRPPQDPGSTASQHLLVLIVDALTLPEPAATSADETEYLRLVNRRAGLVLHAVRQALAGQSDYASRDLFGAVADLPATTYQHARAVQAMSV
jgi:hypothetical protein